MTIPRTHDGAGLHEASKAMLVPAEMATVVDALTAIRIDLAFVLHTGDLPPQAKERLENAVYLLDDTRSAMTRRARHPIDGDSRGLETLGADDTLADSALGR